MNEPATTPNPPNRRPTTRARGECHSTIRESAIERALVKAVEARGGLCLKMVCPGMAGIPDRVVLFDGHAYFVELKAPGRKPTPLQERRHEQLREKGFAVSVIDSVEEIDEYLDWWVYP